MTAAMPTSAEAENTRPVAALPFERRRIHGVTCVVESLHAMRLTGWALVQPWQPAALELRQGERALQATVQRVHRPDVLTRLGADPQMELALGFVMELPPELWERQLPDGSTLLHLSVDGTDTDMPGIRLTLDDLEDWRESLLWSSESADSLTERERLGRHLQHHLTPVELQASVERMERPPAAPVADASPAEVPLRWAVEEVTELSVAGWAVLPDAGQETFEVVCNGQVLPAPCVRHERSDVQQALGSVKLDTGFEVAIPPTIWQHVPAGRTAHLQLLIAGRPVLDPVLKLNTSHLAALVSRWRESGQALSEHASEHRYRALALIEHVKGSGLLAKLPREELKFVADAAAAEGLHLSLPLTARVDPAHMAMAREVWRLQRALNARLSMEAVNAAWLDRALTQTLSEMSDQVSPAAVDRFLVSLIPVFCAHDALASLRSRLPQGELDTLVNSDGRWELSILFPVSLLDELSSGKGSLTGTVNLLERLSRTGDQGWMETAGLRDAWRRLEAEPNLAWLDLADLQRIVELSLRLFEGIGGDPASRLYDAGLIHGMHSLMKLSHRIGEAHGRAVSAAAVRRYGLCPDFWQALAPEPAGAPTSSHLMRRARTDLQQLIAGLRQLAESRQDAVDPCRLALANLRDLGCEDVDSFQRHLLLAHASAEGATASQALSLLQGLPPEEALRWLGRASKPAGEPFPEEEWTRLLRETAPAPPVINVSLRRALLGAPQGRLEAAVALSGEGHGFLGLLWLAQQAHQGEPDAQRALLPALSHAVSLCERHRLRYANPPAVLSNVAAWALGRPASSVTDLTPADSGLQGLAIRVAELWPLQAPVQALPADPAVQVAVPGIGTLVVVKAGGPEEGAHLDRIAGTWGNDLLSVGIPWLVWSPREGPVRLEAPAVPGAPPRVCAPGLLTLLAWLTEQSDFGHVLILDQDAELSVPAWLGHSGGPAHHYHGAAVLRPLGNPPGILDKSPSGTRFASAEHGLALSRFAALRALQLRTSARGARLGRDSFDEEKHLADLLSLADIPLSEEGHVVHARRPPSVERHAFGYLSFVPPAPGVPTVLTHWDRQAAGAAGAAAPAAERRLLPRKLWPTDRTPSHDNHGQSLALVELSSPDKADRLRGAPCMVVAAARNERLLIPHFLDHYRGLGVEHFVVVDNLSTDGSREYLLDQPDVVVYSADSPYSLSRYGVTWQQTVLSAHATGTWALVADLDEFLVWPGCEQESLPMLCTRMAQAGAQAARVLMIDMYPEGRLQEADFSKSAPFEAANCFDVHAATRWQLGSGSFSNSPTWVSGLRHRLLPASAPNHYTAQKVALMKHMPWVRCSEGLHYAAGLEVSPGLLGFAHFKFHSGFHAKVLEEVRRAEHYNAAEEYRQYQALLNENSGSFFDPMHSRRYINSQSFAELLS